MKIILATRQKATWFLMAVVLSGCQPGLTATLPVPTKQSQQSSLLVSLDAPAFIRRDGWNEYQPMGFGTRVNSTDLLKTDGQLVLLCSDLQTIKTFTSLGRNPCPLSNAAGLRHGDMIIVPSSRGAPSSKIPYILHPRNTVILEAHPLLRWHNTGAATYTVQIWRGSEIIWQQSDVTGDILAYPPDAPPLESGKDYLLIVTDDETGASSTEDPNKGLGFQLIDGHQRVEIEKQQQAIMALDNLDASAKSMVLALIYDQIDVNGRGLWGDASSLLFNVSKIRSDAPAVHLYLGTLLVKMKLWREAEAEFELAVEHSQTLDDLESQADALAALWQITGDEQKYDKAVQLYAEIGARNKEDAVRKEHDQ